MKNKYQKSSHILEAKFRGIIRLFTVDLEATQIAEITGVSRQSINAVLRRVRERIAGLAEKESCFREGEIEIDESYFGARRVRGKRGRGAAGKTPVFGILKRKDKVFLTIAKIRSKKELIHIIKGQILNDSTVYTDGWKAYDGLILNGYNCYRVYHSENEFVRGKNHINGIESFWSYAKRRMVKFNSIVSCYI